MPVKDPEHQAAIADARGNGKPKRPAPGRPSRRSGSVSDRAVRLVKQRGREGAPWRHRWYGWS